MKYDSVIFDLDGTLWDACHAVASGWNFALHELKIPRKVNAFEIAAVCGKPQDECVRIVLPEIGPEIFEAAFAVINREEEKSVRKIGGALFPGVAEGLEDLKKQFPLFVVSNCADWYFDGFLNKYSYHNTFRDFECHGRTGKPKGENLKDLIVRNGLKKPVYIGDTTGDQAAAREAGVPFLFAAYGFGKIENETKYPNFSSIVHAILG